MARSYRRVLRRPEALRDLRQAAGNGDVTVEPATPGDDTAGPKLTEPEQAPEASPAKTRKTRKAKS